MGILGIILFTILGSSIGFLLGNRIGRTEKQKSKYAAIGSAIGAGLLMLFSFII